MKYLIAVHYNDHGKKLTGKTIYNMSYNSKTKLDNIDIEDIVHIEVPEQLIDKFEYIISDGKFDDIKVNDIVKLTQTKNIYGIEQTTVTYNKVIAVDTAIRIDNYKNKFNFNGVEISRKKKNIAIIDVLTKEEYDDYIKQNEREIAFDRFRDAINEEKYVYCTAEQLNYMTDIMYGKETVLR